jgi:YD repeat-containing protein
MRSIFLVVLGIVLLSGTGRNDNGFYITGIKITDTLEPAPAQTNGRIVQERLKVKLAATAATSPAAPFASWSFANVSYGDIPEGWSDLLYRKPSRNWMVDANGFLRHVLKNRNNRLAYEPFSNSFLESPTTETRPGLVAAMADNMPANLRVTTKFKKTEDNGVFFSVAGRIQNKSNFYVVMITGNEKLTIAKLKNNELIPLTELVLLRRYYYPEVWELTASFQDDLITGMVYDAKGKLIARADARDGEWATGKCGLYCTDYASAASFNISVPVSEGNIAPIKKSKTASTVYGTYGLIKPVENPDAVPTSFDATATTYDIVISGAGTAGWAAAVQAARMGRSVLLLEETDWIGGQMSSAGVTSMDESGPLIRERGIYREFHESMVNYYYGMDKCPFMAYFWGRNSQNQQEGGYEPRVSRNMLYGFIQDARKKGKLDLLLRTKVTGLTKKGNQVTGADLEQWNETGSLKKKVNCGILVDATEYGDVIPLTGEPYRVGNTKSEAPDMKGKVQDHTFLAVIREYPEGVPEHLKIKEKPPKYDQYSKAYSSRLISGDWVLHRGARSYRAELAWRGMADTKSPLTGKNSQLRHTLTGLNGGNDYPVSVATIEQPEQRLIDEADGIYRTLAKIYYLQNELGVPWSVAEDQGWNTAYNREMMKRRGIPENLQHITKHMAQIPYVRESRRMEGVVMVVAADVDRWEKAKHVPTSVSVGDYFMDLHGTKEYYERDLDNANFAKMGGPFQVPFEAFIPRNLDGFLPAEKNFSQSRLVNGATRLQPITMITGQAVGTIAAVAIAKKVQPRKLSPITVQLVLLEAGSSLIPRWYRDIEWGTELWKATQMCSLYKVMDKKGELEYWDGMEFEAKGNWNRQAPLTATAADTALRTLATVLGYNAKAIGKVSNSTAAVSFTDVQSMARKINATFGSLLNTSRYKGEKALTDEQFALICFELFKSKK